MSGYLFFAWTPVGCVLRVGVVLVVGVLGVCSVRPWCCLFMCLV